MALIESISSESAKEQLKRFMEKILQIDRDIVRFVGIFDTKENCLMTKMQQGKVSYVTQREEDTFALYLKSMKKMQEGLDHALGKVRLMEIRREKLYQLVFFVGNFIIFVTVEPIINRRTIENILNYIEIAIQSIC